MASSQSTSRSSARALPQSRPLSIQTSLDLSPYEDLHKLDRGKVGKLIDFEEEDIFSTNNCLFPDTQKSHLQPSLIDTPIDESNHTSFGSFPATEVSIPQECEQCGRDDSNVSFCNVCDAVFCAACWDKQIQHKRRKTGFSGIPHEKTPASIAQKVQNVLKPPVDESKREQLHLHDADTAWFGIFRPEDGSPLFQDYGRFQDLMIMTEQGNGGSSHASFQGVQSPERDFRTPSLVSFVGETGAGKSTLIKLLIELNSEPHQVYTTPVVGASGSDVPTSEDVHLYLEPQTAYSSTPVLFADCEGLTGGTREPMGALFKKKRSQAKSRATAKDDHLAHKERPLSERKITWADNTLKRSREFAVTNLYPRLLYTFSDVVVFVLREARIMESVFERLVEWAVAALEMSSNQPVLPHAIIVLNASSNDIDPALWNSETATETIFRNLRGTLSNNNVFKKQAQIWRERGQEIESLEQLMLSYYSSVQIIRVPEKGRPKLIQTQAQELYSSIRTACTWARDSRAELRMLLDVEELQSYLDCAFDHFARALDKPFDFVQASLANSPIPLDFGGNILKLAINVMEAWQGESDARMIFQELSYVVASCIMFDLARNKNKGTVESIFPLYLEHLDAALENFCNSHWPCEFVKPGTGARCVNVRSGHAKGHQRKDGKVLAVGEYTSSISFRIYHDEFQKNVFLSLKDLQSLLHKQVVNNEPEERAAAQIHRETVLAAFFRRCFRKKDNNFHSHTACFCCLFELPKHSLPCGHVICTSCAKIYGFKSGKGELWMSGCPLCSCGVAKPELCKIHLKPKMAGVRVLTLDGGGMRGIVELEVLRLIERAMGDKLPIRHFFDLVVGTSTGGIIALGLVSQGWSVEECLTFFERLCATAFTPRIASCLPGISWIINNYHHSLYETSPLERSLVGAFGNDQYLFGGRGAVQSSGVKVAVITTSAATGTPVVLSNYNRPCSEKLSYQFQRSENIKSEVKLWEAGRATSAAPRFFKSFHHEASQQIYLDGAIYHNNPVAIAERERKLIWTDQPSESPDIILSLGTGSSLRHRQDPAASLRRSPISRIPQQGLLANGRNLMKIAKDHVYASLDCDRAWYSFVGDLPQSWESSRFVRISPEKPDLPRLDEVDVMKELQAYVRQKLSSREHEIVIRRLAMRLVATSFFFELRKPIAEDKVASGKLMCRLPKESQEICELAKLIKSWVAFGREPFFFIQQQGSDGTKAKQVPISEDVVEKMIGSREFSMPTVSIELSHKYAPTEIQLCFNESEAFPISGFPRSLFDETAGIRSPLRRDVPVSSSRRTRWVSQFGEGPRKKWTPPITNETDLQKHTSLRTWAQSTEFTGPTSEEIVALAHSQKYGQTPATAADIPQESKFGTALRGALRGIVQKARSPVTRTSAEEEISWPSPRQSPLSEHTRKTSDQTAVPPPCVFEMAGEPSFPAINETRNQPAAIDPRTDYTQINRSSYSSVERQPWSPIGPHAGQRIENEEHIRQQFATILQAKEHLPTPSSNDGTFSIKLPWEDVGRGDSTTYLPDYALISPVGENYAAEGQRWQNTFSNQGTSGALSGAGRGPVKAKSREDRRREIEMGL